LLGPEKLSPRDLRPTRSSMKPREQVVDPGIEIGLVCLQRHFSVIVGILD